MLKTAIILISHQSPKEVTAMGERWSMLNPEALIHIAYGGTRENFRNLTWPNITYIADPRLRTKDHQRERQSYRGVMRAVVEDLAGSGLKRALMVECDVAPLRAGITEYLERRRMEEKADLLAPRLRRVDGTGHPHYLAHQPHPEFGRWMEQSVRAEKGVVLMMLGCLSWWTWEAFSSTASAEEPLPVYLELAMPTTAHLLGYRVRELAEWNDYLRPEGEMGAVISEWAAAGVWVAHPCKNLWKR